ncbi:VCBS repeat-containing protein [Streptomyces sp. NPDC057638]|uniref:VCBS repeat-containing protein n=1 Tax=Streptomyces sp. NPDC057638 TaxID=3346190 RepID=UPI00367B44B8
MDSDFNGDGLRDTAIADPEATVAGKERAGLIRVILGGGKGVVEVSQSMPNILDTAEEGDQFGFSFSSYDADLDGCSDLAVGVPYEDVGDITDAGTVHLLYGSPSGIGQARDSVFTQGATQRLGDTAEVGDLVGYSVATTTSSTSTPYLLIGTPGEDTGTVADAGMVSAVYGAAAQVAAITQDSPGVWEGSEAHDRFGFSLAAAGNWFTVGAPGESTGSVKAVGAITVFKASLNTSGIPDPAWGAFQQRRMLTSDSGAEAGDGFGTALGMAAHRPATAATPTDALIAIGVPGEDYGSIADTGGVQIAQVTATGEAAWHGWIQQGRAGVHGLAEPGDRFGQALAAANTSPSAVSTAATMRLAIGVPGEDTDDDTGTPLTDTGGVALMPLLGSAGAEDVWLEAGDGLPATAASHLLAGLNLFATRSALYVGLPYARSTDRAVHYYPWSTGAGGSPAQSWRPGTGGIPAENTAFGTATR